MSYSEPITARADQILAMVESGKSASEISEETGYHRWSIIRLSRLNGLTLKRGKPGSKQGQHYTKKWR